MLTLCLSLSDLPLWPFLLLPERAKGAEKASCGESVVLFFSAVYSLQALESGVGDSNLQFHLDQWLIDGGIGVLGPVACVHSV